MPDAVKRLLGEKTFARFHVEDQRNGSGQKKEILCHKKEAAEVEVKLREKLSEKEQNLIARDETLKPDTETDEEEGKEISGPVDPSFHTRGNALVGKAEIVFDGEIAEYVEKRIEKAEKNKAGARSVPEPHDQKENENIGQPVLAKGPSQRFVEIVEEPGCKGDMPAAPEFAGIARLPGSLKVADQVVAQNKGRADGYVGIARKIHVLLKSECIDRCQQNPTAVIVKIEENRIGIIGNGVGNEYFFEKPPCDEAASVSQSLQTEAMRYPELRQQVCGAFDGPGYQLWKKGYVKGKNPEVFFGISPLAVHIDGIAEGLKCVKRDADRQQQAVFGFREIEIENLKELAESFVEETQIFKGDEQAEVASNAEPKPAFALLSTRF